MTQLEQLQEALMGRKVVGVECTGNLSIDDSEGYLITLEDGTQVLFSWYRDYDCTGVAFEVLSYCECAIPNKAWKESSGWCCTKCHRKLKFQY